MLKEIPIPKIMTVMIISLILLFAGYYIYQMLQVQNPIEQSLSQIDGVKVEHVDFSRNKIDVTLTLYNVEHFQSTYQTIEDNIKPFQKNRQVNIFFTNKGSEEMVNAWNESYFYIAEAIDQNHYSLIPKAVETLKNRINLDQAGYSMDNQYIYIDLHKEKSSLYIVIPKTDDAMEVSKIG